MRYRHIICMVILILIPGASLAEFYRYTDKRGVTFFTDDISRVPEDQRPQAYRYSEPDDLLTPEEKAEKRRQETERVQEEQQAAQEEKEEKASLAEKLNRKKAAMDKEYAELVDKKQALTKERETITTEAEVRAYMDKVVRFNVDIAAYEKRRKAFQDEVDDFNPSITD